MDKVLPLPPAEPLSGVLVTAPNPEQKIVSASALVAGREVTPGMAPTGATKVAVLAIWMAPWVAELVVAKVKIPGAAAETFSKMVGLIPPALITVKVAVDEESSCQGT